MSDFHELNKQIKHKPYPILKVQDVLMHLKGFDYASSIDINMGYYHIERSPNAKCLCTIVLPWGKYEYQHLPMGLCNSPDIFKKRCPSCLSVWSMSLHTSTTSWYLPAAHGKTISKNSRRFSQGSKMQELK